MLLRNAELHLARGDVEGYLHGIEKMQMEWDHELAERRLVP